MADLLPVTVVMPAYNARATLAQALESVRIQTRPPSEIIVVDDGSTDDTAAIARDFGARVIGQSNCGISHARNVAVRAAQSAWIAFLDADDVWWPDRLERQWALHESYPHDMVVASNYTYLVDGRIIEASVLPTLRQYRSMQQTSLGHGYARITRADLLAAIVRANFVLPSSLLVERRLFSELGVFFLEREHLPDGGAEFFIGEDYEWLLRVLLHTDVLLVQRALVDYRRSVTSMSAQGGRLRFGDVKLGEIVRATPERYAVGAAEAFARVLPDQLVHAGSRYLSDGDIVRAHAMFRHARDTGDIRSRLMMGLTAPFVTRPGREAFEIVHHAWRRRIRPALAKLRHLVR